MNEQNLSQQENSTVQEKFTAPVESIAQHAIDVDDDAFNRISGLLSQRPQRRGFFYRIAQAVGAYLTTLLITLPVLPIMVSIVTIGLYLSNLFVSSWLSVLYGTLFALIAWMVISLLFIPFTSPRNANSRSYSVLESRLLQLETRLFVINDQHHANPDQALAEYQEVALQEAHDKFDDLNNVLNDRTIRFPWVTGVGYVNAWSKLHSAEEALVEVEPVEMVMRGAIHDNLAISNSQIYNRDELLSILRRAVGTIERSMPGYFKIADSWSDEEETDESNKSNERKNVGQSVSHATSSNNNEIDEAPTRVALREVRRAFNDYRDSLWEGLIRARNNLWVTIFITGLITSILLCIAILSISPANGHSAIISVVAFYMIGAIAGLFDAIRRESMTDTHINDYGLVITRLILTPLLSGLAGVGGVLIVSLLFGTFFSRQTANSLENIFQLNSPGYLIVSAFFGFLSNLFSGNLQIHAKQYISALSKNRVVNQGEDKPVLYSVADRQLKEVFDYDLRQARQWSRISAFTAIVGLLFIAGGVVTVLTWNILVGFVFAIAGGIMEFVAAFSLQKVKMANNLLDKSSENLREAKKSNEAPLAELLKL